MTTAYLTHTVTVNPGLPTQTEHTEAHNYVIRDEAFGFTTTCTGCDYRSYYSIGD